MRVSVVKSQRCRGRLLVVSDSLISGREDRSRAETTEEAGHKQRCTAHMGSTAVFRCHQSPGDTANAGGVTGKR